MSTQRPGLDVLIAEAKARGPMTDEELRLQRESWVRGEMGIGLDQEEEAYRRAMFEGETGRQG